MSFVKQPKIFIIDQSLSYQKVINGCLEALQLYDVKTFSSGEACYEHRKNIADLIILDFNLGEYNWNGIDFMMEYKQINAKTSFLFLSSNTNIETAVSAVRNGAVDYILKSKLGLARLTQRIEVLKEVHRKRSIDRITRSILIGAIALLGAAMVILSLLYS